MQILEMSRTGPFVLVLVLLGWILPASAEEARLTIYGDGKSCPGDCDAHVVFHHSMNGTPHAHAIGGGSAAGELPPCERGEMCRICFDGMPSSCIEVRYRGGGPGPWTFDFTPAFYLEWCEKDDVPAALGEKCAELARGAEKLEGRVNCIRRPEHERCRKRMEKAKAEKEADLAVYEECVRLGQDEFNRTRPREENRTNDCTYERLATGGPNSRGLRWKRLLPGACWEGAYVGRDGLHCCTGDPLIDGAYGTECRRFYRRP